MRDTRRIRLHEKELLWFSITKLIAKSEVI